jgi:hypothetical protein
MSYISRVYSGETLAARINLNVQTIYMFKRFKMRILGGVDLQPNMLLYGSQRNMSVYKW